MGNAAAPPTVHVVELVFEILRADLPIAGIRHSPKIWNHVDETRVEASQMAELARNGLRVGAAPPESWPAIRAILAACGAEVRKDQSPVQRGFPLVVSLGPLDPGDTIFAYRHDNRLAGKTFPGGDKLLQIDYLYRPELAGFFEVSASFEIRQDRGTMTWERVEGIIQQVPAYDRHVFDDLAARVVLHPGGCLVVGPGAGAQNEYSIGGRFFMGHRDGKEYETLLFLTPLPYQVQTGGRKG